MHDLRFIWEGTGDNERYPLEAFHGCRVIPLAAQAVSAVSGGASAMMPGGIGILYPTKTQVRAGSPMGRAR